MTDEDKQDNPVMDPVEFASNFGVLVGTRRALKVAATTVWISFKQMDAQGLFEGPIDREQVEHLFAMLAQAFEKLAAMQLQTVPSHIAEEVRKLEQREERDAGSNNQAS